MPHHVHTASPDPLGLPRRADLRDPHASIDPERHTWSMWRSLSSIDLGPAEIHRFVENCLGPGRRRILEVGCGSGYLSLELARSGHAVLGLDPSAEALAVARRSAAGSKAPIPGSLVYAETSLEAWDAEPGSFDAAVFNLSLHHLHDLPGGLAKVRRSLAPGGLLVVNDFGYDRLDEATAAWMVEAEALLGLREPQTSAEPAWDPARAIAGFRHHWLEHFAEHGLHGFEALRTALDRHFQEDLFVDAPYLFLRLANAVPAAPAARAEPHVAVLRALEALHMARGTIRAVGFRFAGRPR